MFEPGASTRGKRELNPVEYTLLEELLRSNGVNLETKQTLKEMGEKE
jgi:hypothetical protein